MKPEQMIDIASFVPAAILLAAMFIPLAMAVGVVFVQQRLEQRDERRSPFKEKLLHQAGSQARRKAEDLGDEIVARTALLMLVGPIGILALLLPRVQWANLHLRPLDWLLIAILVGVMLWCLRDIVRFRRERRAWLNGMHGEMAVAQALDRLRIHDCEVFHDVAGARGNIDHVVVAQNAVYAVETKWRSKRGKGSSSAQVWFDGESLQFPSGFRDAGPVEQARACAADLARFLTGRTGESVNVVPVVALPGWYTTNRPEASGSPVIVMNPKMSGMLANQSGTKLPTAQRNRIINAIAERYPEADS